MIFWSFCIKAKGHTTDANGNKLRKEVYTDELILNGTLQDKTYRANTIRSSAQAPTNSTVTLEGRDSVVIGPGSEILAGSEFTTRIDPTLVPVDQTDYIGGIEYFNGSIEAIYHPQGRAVLDGSTWRHEYVITDHLGNTRLRFSDLDGSGTIDSTELLSTHDYYPFGLEWQDGGYKYTYNGNERISAIGVNLIDFNFRTYDPAISRYLQPDLLSEWAPELNPFRFGFNNPATYWDPLGLFESKAEARQYRRQIRREARQNGETFGGARIVKNEDGRYDLRFKNSDGYVTRTEAGEMEFGAVASYTGASIKEDKPNFFEKARKKGGFLGDLMYSTIDDAWLTVQRFNPFDTRTTHLSGYIASKDEYTMGFVNTVASGTPIGLETKATKAVIPEGIKILKKLNAAEYSKLFKGTFLARMHPKGRGRVNRLMNKGSEELNSTIQSADIIITPLTSIGNEKK